MKNKLAFIAAVAMIFASLSACGTIEDDKSYPQSENMADDSSQAAVDSSESEEPSSNADVSSESESVTDSASESFEGVSGYFIETVNGKESGYVIINENASYLVLTGTVTGIPLGIDLTADTIIVNRGGVSDNKEKSYYTYDGAALEFEAGGSSYVWTKIDYIPVSGTYYEVDSDGTNLAKWTFNGDGTGNRTSLDTQTETAFNYTQSADAFNVSMDSDKNIEYGYTYDIFRLVLTSQNETVTLAAAES